jgi:Transposase DDE domain
MLSNLRHPDSPTTSTNLESRLPDVYLRTDRFLLGRRRPRVLKSQEPFDLRYPRVVYLVREPRDVAISYRRYLRTCAASARCATTGRCRTICTRPRSGRLVLDRQRTAAEERLDGKYLLTTSDPSLSAEDVALGYKQLQDAERSFRDLKGTLLLRPVFHRKDDRIRAHVLICFLALVLVRLAETRSGETWRTIRAQLGQIRQGHFQSPEGDFTQTSELTAGQRDLHAALGVPEPPRFGRITPAAASQTA